MKIFSHESPEYIWTNPNGACEYSKEIVKYFIPNIKTTRNWVTINVKGHAYDHSIVFIHYNFDPSIYEWLKDYNDLILVCSLPETVEKVKEYGHPVLVPLSIPIEEVKKYRVEKKTKVKAYAGRKGKYASVNARNCDRIENLPRDEFLRKMAEYQYIYAVGRTALEAKVLGCKILKYDPRFPDTTRWKVMDTMEAVKILQEELDKAEREIVADNNAPMRNLDRGVTVTNIEREIMAGTKEGGKKASITIKEIHGEDFYKRIGSKGGKSGDPSKRGFASNPELAREAGRKGGTKSRRGKSKKNSEETRVQENEEKR